MMAEMLQQQQGMMHSQTDRPRHSDPSDSGDNEVGEESGRSGNLTERKSFSKVLEFSGQPEQFSSWKLRMRKFLDDTGELKALLDWIETLPLADEGQGNPELKTLVSNDFS